MRPGTYPLSLYRGDTYVWQFNLYANVPPPPTPPVPSDLTGVVAKAEIRSAPGGAAVLATMECEVELPNIVHMKLLTPMWTGLVVRQAAWDLQLTYPDPDASVITIIAGPVTITPDVTDAVALTVLTTSRARANG